MEDVCTRRSGHHVLRPRACESPPQAWVIAITMLARAPALIPWIQPGGDSRHVQLA